MSQLKKGKDFVEWVIRNPELAEKYHPDLMEGLSERIKNSDPFFLAIIVQKLPEHFPKWKHEAEQHFGIKRQKMLKGYIDLITSVLYEYEYPSEIEQQAVESVRAELAEQLEYWIGERNKNEYNDFLKQMAKPMSWYKMVLQINEELELRKQGKDFHPLDLLLGEQTKAIIKLFNECEFVGFSKQDAEAQTIISNVIVRVQNQSSAKLDNVPDNPFFTLYIGFCYLERVLQLIKSEYEGNLSVSIEHLENIIYKSEDYENLIEVSRRIGRNIINNKQHPDFGILKRHIAEQLEFIERKNKVAKAKADSPQIPERTQKVIDGLNQFKFAEFLIGKEYDAAKVYNLMAENAGREQMPYCIALMDATGYLQYFYTQFAKNKDEGHKKLAEVFEVNARRIRGNVNVLSPKSKEDSTEYTSVTFKETVTKQLEGRK